MIGIYKITSPTGRIYIGQSTNMEKRFVSYKKMYVKNKEQTTSRMKRQKRTAIRRAIEIY